jgi:hypothetical protein
MAVIAPPRRRATAVARNEDCRLKLHPFVELTVDQTFLSAVEAFEVFADPRLADIDTINSDLDAAVIAEKVRRLSP